MAKLIVTLEGDQEYIDAGLDSFARSCGYTDSDDENALSKLEISEADLKKYFRDKVSSYNANKASEEARIFALEQSTVVLNQVRLSVKVEPTIIPD